ncbi:AbrB/MazE/SpoVT family DNA-binding domain-containing protein [Facklamia sp. P12932]|uniref:AbrB/MazE/SpoVT family DNA-binding domain-containing protein n=1 Tax=Facklamia sp. P12932 TaxID=3421947 RepID=UPI003D17D93E
MDNFIENAKVMSKGQVTIPKAVRDLMGIAPGDRVSFLVNQGKVQIINSKDYLLAYEENITKEESRGGEDES